MKGLVRKFLVPRTEMAKTQQSVSRVLGYPPIRISAGLKRAIWSSILAIACAVTATGISDSAAVSDTLRYIFSPGTMLAIRVVRAEPSHRGVGVFIDVLNWYGRAMSFALMINVILYGLFVFGIIATVSGLRAEKR
jgi:hypothetical protein